MRKWLKKHIVEIIIFGFLYIIIVLFFTLPLPLEIYLPGGITEINQSVVKINTEYEREGTFNSSYVSVITRPTPYQWFLALFNNRADIRVLTTQENKLSNEEMLESSRLDKIQSIYTSLKLAYEAANKELNYTTDGVLVIYRSPLYEDTFPYFRVGDIIKKVNDQIILDTKRLSEVVSILDCDEIINFTVLRAGQEVTFSVKRQKDIDDPYTCRFGISLSDSIAEITGDPTFEILNISGYGSSGGLMQTLSFYDDLTEIDLTNGKKIAGTGVIAVDGTILPIGGMEQKVYGAILAGVDIFFAPNLTDDFDLDGDEENLYEIALAAKELMKDDIIIYPVLTFEDALNYLLEETSE